MHHIDQLVFPKINPLVLGFLYTIIPQSRTQIATLHQLAKRRCQAMLNTWLSLRLTFGGARSLLKSTCRIPYSTSSRLLKWKSSRLDHLLANMPKEEPHLKELKEKRMAKRSARALTQPANITWQVNKC